MSCADPPMNRTPRGRWVCDICDPSRRAHPDETPRSPLLPDVLAPGQTCVLTIENERRLCPPHKVAKKRQHSVDATATAAGAATRATPLHSTDTHASASSSAHASTPSATAADGEQSASAPSEKKRSRRGGAARSSLTNAVLERELSASSLAAQLKDKESLLTIDTAHPKRAPSLDDAAAASRKPLKKRKPALSPSARLSQSSSSSGKAKAHAVESLSPALHSSRVDSATGGSESHISGVHSFNTTLIVAMQMQNITVNARCIEHYVSTQLLQLHWFATIISCIIKIVLTRHYVMVQTRGII